MQDSSLRNLFGTAARHAIAFRTRDDALSHSPDYSYRDCLKTFTESTPEKGVPSEKIINELVCKTKGGLMMSTGRRFFGWVIGASHPAGVAADWLASAWGQNAGNHLATPAAAAAEAVSAAWLLDILELPKESSVGFATGATMANFTCLAAARGQVLLEAGWDADRQGLFGAPPITVLIGDDGHTTVFSALQYLGLGHDRVVRVATDGQGAIRADAFAEAMENVSGPCIVILQAGQINTGAFDPFRRIIPMAKAKGAWVHVDGAFGLWAKSAPERRSLADGIELADSWGTDGHKWLQTPYDCGFAIVRHELTHRRAMSISASYLPATAEGDRNPVNYVPELSRRARGFATWAVIKALGREGIAEMIERNCRVAKLMADLLGREPGVEIVNDVVLNQVSVCFGTDLGPERADDITTKTIARIQQDGVCFAGGAKWRGRQIMRISVTGGETTDDDGKISAQAMIKAYRIARQQG
jgi:glutamate/tyrosine decarboxylase-like PLP-dependent enzyme